jgi:hypothetical protein
MLVYGQLKKKLDYNREKIIFIGCSSNSKAYKLYNPNTKKVIINEDVTFHEVGICNWFSKSKKVL